MAMVEAGGDIRSTSEHTGRGITVGLMKVLGLGRGSRSLGLKVQATDRQRDPGNVQGDE